MEKRKNGKIELIRFIFTMFIVFYHCQRHYLKGVLYAGHFTFFARGYIGVEFFFLVTGFFMQGLPISTGQNCRRLRGMSRVPLRALAGRRRPLSGEK